MLLVTYPSTNFWKSLPRLLPAIALFLHMSCANASVGIDENVIGKWKLTVARGSAAITSRDEKEARQLIGKIVSIHKDKSQFPGQTCGPSEFEAERVDVRLVLRQDFRASADGLGLPKSATLVDLSCTSVFIKGRDKLLIFWDGWFFDAARVR